MTENNSTISRQRLWQLKMKENGRCEQCGKPSGGLSHCPECSVKSREAIRARNGFKAKIKGGRGRPQIY